MNREEEEEELLLSAEMKGPNTDREQPLVVSRPLTESDIMEKLTEIVAEHLGKTLEEMKKLTPEQQQQELIAAGLDYNFIDLLRQLTEAEAAKHLARQWAKDEAERDMIKKLLNGKKKLSPEKRKELEDREAELELNLDMYREMMKKLLASEQKRFNMMSREEQLAHQRMLEKLAAGKKKKGKNEELAASVAEAIAAAAAHMGDDNELTALFDDLAIKGSWDCPVCFARNARLQQECKLCGTTNELSQSITLSNETVLSAHRMIHACNCGIATVETIVKAVGPCVKHNFLPIMQALIIACRRDDQVYWDFYGDDGEGQGAMEQRSAEMVWAFNNHDVPNPRFQVFFNKHKNAANLIGWQDFRDECVQMPNVQEYLF